MLGSGTSSGVPRIGNDWGTCDPSEPKNRRRRVSILVEEGATRVLVDTSPDFREQMLSANADRLDAILFTHDHADHTHGIDDVRQIFHAMRRPVDCYAHPATWKRMRSRFDYVFEGRDGYPPTCFAHDMPEKLVIGALTITQFEQVHGNIGSSGFRFEAGGRAAAYSTDVNELPPEADGALQDLDLWIVDALRRTPHPTHAHLDRTLGWIEKYRPGRAVLTHMDQSMDYATLRAELPAGVEPGYDMLVMEP
ncbi:MBL fold metallo-hydrolase [Sphingoaurantiacus capsulatus]|uniref:MBL fold metallo-hydrolase n=1 Tax=Sphingoaurantiacus capsulatus TaxID=1771310 RepID=A0ABV7XED6_9SPHN